MDGEDRSQGQGGIRLDALQAEGCDRGSVPKDSGRGLGPAPPQGGPGARFEDRICNYIREFTSSHDQLRRKTKANSAVEIIHPAAVCRPPSRPSMEAICGR